VGELEFFASFYFFLDDPQLRCSLVFFPSPPWMRNVFSETADVSLIRLLVFFEWVDILPFWRVLFPLPLLSCYAFFFPYKLSPRLHRTHQRSFCEACRARSHLPTLGPLFWFPPRRARLIFLGQESFHPCCRQPVPPSLLPLFVFFPLFFSDLFAALCGLSLFGILFFSAPDSAKRLLPWRELFPFSPFSFPPLFFAHFIGLTADPSSMSRTQPYALF